MSQFFLFFFRQSGEAYGWRVCYQWGLPRLVFKGDGSLEHFFKGMRDTQVILSFSHVMAPLEPIRDNNKFKETFNRLKKKQPKIVKMVFL